MLVERTVQHSRFWAGLTVLLSKHQLGSSVPLWGLQNPHDHHVIGVKKKIVCSLPGFGNWAYVGPTRSIIAHLLSPTYCYLRQNSPGACWAGRTNLADHVSNGCIPGRRPERSALIVVVHVFRWPPVRLRHVRGSLDGSRPLISLPSHFQTSGAFFARAVLVYLQVRGGDAVPFRVDRETRLFLCWLANPRIG